MCWQWVFSVSEEPSLSACNGRTLSKTRFPIAAGGHDDLFFLFAAKQASQFKKVVSFVSSYCGERNPHTWLWRLPEPQVLSRTHKCCSSLVDALAIPQGQLPLVAVNSNMWRLRELRRDVAHPNLTEAADSSAQQRSHRNFARLPADGADSPRLGTRLKQCTPSANALNKLHGLVLLLGARAHRALQSQKESEPFAPTSKSCSQKSQTPSCWWKNTKRKQVPPFWGALQRNTFFGNMLIFKSLFGPASSSLQCQQTKLKRWQQV